MILHQSIWMAGLIALSILLSSNLSIAFAQEKMEVDGIVHSKIGGFKFPDDTVQGTAAANLTPEEVADQRGRIRVTYGGIGGLGSIPFNALKVSFSAFLAGSQTQFGDVEIVHNIDEWWPYFFAEFADGSPPSSAKIEYYDENDVHYMTIRLSLGMNIERFEHSTIPFGAGSFGHTFLMRLSYAKIQIKDEIHNLCRCWDIQANDDCVCTI